MGEDEDEFIDDDGAVDDDALEEHIAHQDAAYVRKRNLLFSLMKIVEDEEMDKTEVDAVAFREQFRRQHRGNKKRRKAKRKWYCDPITGKMRRVCPHLSNWWLDYIQNPEPDCPSWNKVFRQRFRLPYPSYIQILEWVSGDDCDGLFDRWQTEAGVFTGRRNNKRVSPIELLLLGTLRYLGQVWTFDDIKDGTKVSRDVHRCCFMHSQDSVQIFFIHGMHACHKVLPTCEISSPSMQRPAFLDASVASMLLISHWTRSLFRFAKHTLDPKLGRTRLRGLTI